MSFVFYLIPSGCTKLNAEQSPEILNAQSWLRCLKEATDINKRQYIYIKGKHGFKKLNIDKILELTKNFLIFKILQI